MGRNHRAQSVRHQRVERRKRRRILPLTPTGKLVLGVVLLFVGVWTFATLFSSYAKAQPRPTPPDSEYLFLEDKKKKEKKDTSSVEEQALKKKKKEFDAAAKTGKLPFDVNAKQISYDSSGNKLLCDGGLIIKYSSMVLEAMKGVVDLTTNEALVSGDVRMNDLTGTITSDSARVDLKTGTGVMENADVFFSAGEFQLKGQEVGKESDETYTLKEGTLTTCQCNEGEKDTCPPWRIRANEARIVRNGYGQAWGAKLDIYNIPVFYTPYLIFPAKTERQTGFLPFTYGTGHNSSFDLVAPFFLDIDDSTDLTTKGIFESNVRYGFDNEFRKVFSRTSDMDLGFIYLNEDWRGSDLLGTDTSGLFDKTHDTNRFAGFLNQTWKGKAGDVPLQLITKGKYVSDDLLLREYENKHIGPYNSRFVTSQMDFRVPVSSSFSVDVLGEYNQSLANENDDFVLQRLPEVDVTGINVFHPFGENPFGLKLVSSTDLSAVDFSRKTSYDGWRSEAYESLSVPFYFRNYFDATLEGTGRASEYSLNETKNISQENPNQPNPEELDSSSDRFVPGFNYKMGTVLERVYNLDDGNPLKTIGELGTAGRSQEFNRVKHTIEPGFKYKFVPQVDQSSNPVFDSTDHLSQKSVVTYQLVQRLLGRYEPRDAYLYGVEETTPDVESLGSLRSSTPLDESLMFGFAGDDTSDDFQRLRTGSIREFATLKLSQSYDFIEPNNSATSNVDQFSDISTDLILYPNDYVYLRARADYNQHISDFDSYLLESQVEDKRGDRVRARFRDVENVSSPVRQLEGNLELKLTDSLRLGYYARYDDIEGQFLETKVGMRYISSCKCWVFDVDFGDRVNPDETRVTFNITLIGLGELDQHFFPGSKSKTH